MQTMPCKCKNANLSTKCELECEIYRKHEELAKNDAKTRLNGCKTML